MYELPDTYSSSPYGKFFGLQSHLANVDHALEFGPDNKGSGAIWLAQQKSDLQISTVGTAEHDVATARKNIQNAGLANRIMVMEAGDVQTLSSKHAIHAQHVSKGVGFSYIDADRPDFSTDFEAAIQMSYPGACILVDNVIRQDHKYNAPSPMQASNKAKLIREIRRDERVGGVMMQVFGQYGIEGYFMMKVL